LPVPKGDSLCTVSSTSPEVLDERWGKKNGFERAFEKQRTAEKKALSRGRSRGKKPSFESPW